MRNYADLKGHLHADLDHNGADGFGFLSDTEVSSAFAKSLADSFYKKLCPSGNSPQADEAALQKFLKINSKCPEGPFDFDAKDEQESCFYDYLKDNLNRALENHLVFEDDTPDWLDEKQRALKELDAPFDLDFIRETMAVGPGASQLADASCMTTKLFDGPVSYANSEYLITVYRAALVETGLWADAEMHRFSKFGFTKVNGGKVFFAPKNSEISRTCCTEANLNMLVQKSCGTYLERKLEKFFGISLETQPDRNKEMARLGSIDGSYGTIDLTSASDSISLSLFDDLVRPSFFKTMVMMSRSEFAVLPNGDKVRMRMISTMGNGFTFPLQTIIFASAVRAVYQIMGFPCSDSRTHYGVFGDDIVVRRETYVFLCRMLNKLGFEVNEGKSFNSGPFRESCGGDYFRGHNIRGVYIRSLETPQQVASAVNRLTRWAARSGIPLPRTLTWLMALAESLRIPRVPYSESDDAGIKVPFRLSKPVVDNCYWFRYRYLKKHSSTMVMPEPDDSPNPCGYGLSFLSGHTRRSDGWSLHEPWTFTGATVRISLRDPPQAIRRHKVRKRAIPYWDWHGLGEGGDPLSHEAWKSFMVASFH
jgi:hypothetical protein